MTANRDFKRIVRARMKKTGEAYTAARSQLLRNKARDYATLAGKSDEAIKKNTGCDWKAWVGALDYVKAHNWPHREIAQYVHDRYRIDGWWAQTVTVGYERIKGLREVGQRRDGKYEANKSRTLAAPVGRLFAAWAQKKQRDAWLGAEVTLRTSGRNRYLRFIWGDGTPVVVGFTPKGRSRCQVAVQHMKLPDKAAAERLKTYWSERFDALAEQLGTTA